MKTKLTQEQKSLFESISQDSDVSMDMIQKIWDSSASYEPQVVFNKEAAFNKFMDQINSEPVSDVSSTGSSSMKTIIIGSILAIAIAVGLFFAYQSVFSYKTIKTTDEIQFAMLDDGTEVWINKHSELRYPRNFASNERSVNLKGEAYFDVSRDETAPFYVELSNDNVVTVLGTSFNINDKYDSKVEVSVTEGKVNLKNVNDHSLSIDLTAGKRGILNTANGKVRSEDFDDNVMAWKESELNFSSASIEDVIQDLGPFYGVQFKIDNANIDCSLNNVTFDRDMTIDQAVSIINKPFSGLKITKSTNTLYYVQGTCK